jgi:hypothetical protein
MQNTNTRWFAGTFVSVFTLMIAEPEPVRAQALQPGEAVVTRFSGTSEIQGPGGQKFLGINLNGISASIIDLRSPSRPPQGSHLVGKTQRAPATSLQVGQVFGVALDQGPNIYLAATSAFGLHRLPDNSNWMPGMWGEGGGPGTIYRLDRQSGYAPRPFANITLNGRPNTGAGLGNIAFDRVNQQLFVSDLETGMIHRIRTSDGADQGFYDHGVQGRASFTDAGDRQRKSLPQIPFNMNSRARINDCPSGQFQLQADCWNYASNGRRVWGVGVGRTAGGDLRLYYSVSSSPDLGEKNWASLSDEEKRNSVWSVRIGQGGAFDPSDVRREFILPDFFFNEKDAADGGYSRPVSDISFPVCTDRPVMLLAERGGMRNLGLEAENPFATPHESRALRYELHRDGTWRPIGRYDVGSYARYEEGAPQMNANCAGGIAFGPGYSQAWRVDPRQADQFVWISGDALCSPRGPCNNADFLPNTQPAAADQSEVHGVQGQVESAYGELAPRSAYATGPKSTPANFTAAAVGLDQAFMVDVDTMIDASGSPIFDELTRNDATKIGDIAVYEFCQAQPAGFVPVLAAPPLLIFEPGHSPQESHVRFASHSTRFSHYRYGSHWPLMSHNQWGSHYPAGSMKHFPYGSYQHLPPGSVHFPVGSYKHFPFGSVITHQPKGSVKHMPPGSAHAVIVSMKHADAISKIKAHVPPASHQPFGSVKQHFPKGSDIKLPHQPAGSHQPVGSGKHFPVGSNIKVHQPLGSHQPVGSVKQHFPVGSNIKLHEPPGSVKQHLPKGSNIKLHEPPGSVKQHFPVGSNIKVHQPPGSQKQHLPVGSNIKLHQPVGSVKQHVPVGSNIKVHQPQGSHQPQASNAKLKQKLKQPDN